MRIAIITIATHLLQSAEMRSAACAHLDDVMRGNGGVFSLRSDTVEVTREPM